MLGGGDDGHVGAGELREAAEGQLGQTPFSVQFTSLPSQVLGPHSGCMIIPGKGGTQDTDGTRSWVGSRGAANAGHLGTPEKRSVLEPL